MSAMNKNCELAAVIVTLITLIDRIKIVKKKTKVCVLHFTGAYCELSIIISSSKNVNTLKNIKICLQIAIVP